MYKIWLSRIFCGAFFNFLWYLLVQSVPKYLGLFQHVGTFQCTISYNWSYHSFFNCLMYDSSYEFPYNDNKMIVLLNITWKCGVSTSANSLKYLGTLCRGQNNSQSNNINHQILSCFCPQFSVIIELTGHFFSWTTGKEFVRDTLKPLEII